MCNKPGGPGPGAYLLPSTIGYPKHDPSKHRNPQYSMGLRVGFGAKGVGPGPTYDICRMTRYGKANVPAYSLASRNREISKLNTPGPGTYSLDNDKKNPAYTMAARFQELTKSPTPAPNQYVLASSLGPKVPDKLASAAYSIVGNHGMSCKAQSPGPATYGGIAIDNYKYKPPKFSMVGRNDPHYSQPNPGPAAYLPKMPKSCSQGYSFGNRTCAYPYITADDVIPCTRGGIPSN